MSINKETPDYLKPYQHAVEEHGGTFNATLWCSKEGQVLRFKTFLDFVDFSGTSIVDVGCGIGDFAKFLIENNVKYNSFHGIDAMKKMVDTASTFEYENASFETLDIVLNLDALHGYDWITFSGTLNAMKQASAMELVSHSYEHCNVGVAFNFLSNQNHRDPAIEDLTPATRFNTIEILAHAFALTPLVTFTQSYLLGHDATIILHKHEIPQ